MICLEYINWEDFKYVSKQCSLQFNIAYIEIYHFSFTPGKPSNLNEKQKNIGSSNKRDKLSLSYLWHDGLLLNQKYTD